jgi:hypothetical protein
MLSLGSKKEGDEILIQIPLFEKEEEEGAITQKIIKGPRPLAKKNVVLPQAIDREIAFKEEVVRIFRATDNRMYIFSANWREMQDISQALVSALEKIGGPLEKIVDRIVSLLTIKTNLFSIQAIQLIETMGKEKKKIRR